MTRRWVTFADEWDPETDPALIRMREALSLPPTPESSQTSQEPPRAAVEVVLDSEGTPEPAGRSRIADLIARVQAGDRSAVAILRSLLDR